MDESELRDEIVRLEARVEVLDARLESCRKLVMASRIMIAVGGALMLSLALGLSRSGAATFITSIAALLGGVVLWGSNRSTAREATAQRAAAEARRAELIGLVNLQVIRDNASLSSLSGKARPVPSA